MMQGQTQITNIKLHFNYKFYLYRPVNTGRLGYNIQSLNTVEGNNRCVLKSIYNTKKGSRTRTYFALLNLVVYDLSNRYHTRFPVVSLGIFFVVPPDKTMCPGVDSTHENVYQGFLLG